MITLEFKAYGKSKQFKAIDEAIRTVQFIRNKSIRYWIDNEKTGKNELSAYCAVLAKEFSFCNALNSQARQASAERAWISISKFFSNCKSKVAGKKGYPQFQKDCRSVEYKTTGWKIDDKFITFSDGNGIGRLRIRGSRDLALYSKEQIKRVRIVRKADGYYVQLCIKVERLETVEPTGNAIGLDVGLKEFYTDSNGDSVPNPRFLRKSEARTKFLQRRLSRKVKGSNNRSKARVKLARKHLSISRQRKDFAIKLARCVILSNDMVVYENLAVKNLVKNHCLAKSISDASWYQFRVYLEYFAKVFGKVTISVNPAYTSQDCSKCGARVKKSLSTRTHICKCGCMLDRDYNAAINILNRGLESLTNRVGHTRINA